MRIDLKQPKYVLPLIALPFLCVFFHIYQSTFATGSVPIEGKDSLQGSIADVSAEVKQRSLADKLEAYQQHFRDGGYTAIGQIQQEEADAAPDSIQRPVDRPSGYTPPADGSDYAQQDRELAEALAALQQPARDAPAQPEVDPIALFRQQLAIADSFSRAGDPEQQARDARLAQQQARAEALPQPERVTRPGAHADRAFATIRRGQRHEGFIQAIVDESVKGYAGSRLRIRLLDDILAGPQLIPEGTLLFAELSGFSGQRVKLTITSVMQEGRIIPVRLEVYDLDGLPGLYVPASAFREFTRELGGGAAQGVSMQGMGPDNQQLMGLVQRLFSSTSGAVTRQVRKNKAKLKYNTLVYLVDPRSLSEYQ